MKSIYNANTGYKIMVWPRCAKKLKTESLLKKQKEKDWKYTKILI